MPAPPSATADEIRDVNARYHDGAAAGYDAKWGIDYGDVGRAQVIGKVAKALGGRPARFARSLEIGAGTGYFSLNLVRAGIVDDAVATDISQGMLNALNTTAERLGISQITARRHLGAIEGKVGARTRAELLDILLPERRSRG